MPTKFGNVVRIFGPETVVNGATPNQDATTAINAAVQYMLDTYGGGTVRMPRANATWLVNPQTVSGSVIQGVVIDDRIVIDLAGGELKLIDGWVWPASHKANASRKMHIVSCKNPFTVGVTRRLCGVVNGSINGNAVNQGNFAPTVYDAALDGICDGLFVSRTLAPITRDLVVKNVPGHGTNPSNGELFHISFNRCQKVSLDNVVVYSDDGGSTSSGIGFDFTNDIDLGSSWVDNMTTAMGFTFYACSGIKGSQARATRCPNGFNFERCNDMEVNVVAGGRSANSTTLVATPSPFLATDISLGNGTGVRLQGCERFRVTGVSSFNTSHGITVQTNTAEAAKDCKDGTIDMVLTDNGGYGYNEAVATGGGHANIKLASSCVFARNTSGAMSRYSTAIYGSPASDEMYQSGKYYFTFPASSTAAAAMTQDRMAATRWQIRGRAAAIDKIGLEVTTLAASSSIRVGIYADNGAGAPGALVAEMGTIDSTTTGVKEITLAGAALAAVAQIDPSLLWVVCAAQGGAPSVRVLNNVTTQLNYGGTQPGSAASSNAYFQDGVSGAFPANFTGTGVFGGGPRTFIRTAA